MSICMIGVRIYFLFFLTIGTSLSLHARRKRPVKQVQEMIIPVAPLLPGNVTIYIHGTIFPLISYMLHKGDLARGLFTFQTCESPNLKRIAQVLIDTDPGHFSCENFYFYNWSGSLNFNERRKAAQILFDALKKHEGSVTIIGHSHGASIALYLAELAEQQKASLCIDRLVLLATPVQAATAHFLCSPIFKRVYSFYSTADILQIADPQGLYKETKKISIIKKSPFFSKRLFPESPNVIQARVLMNYQSPTHRSFAMPRFLKRLPEMLAFLDTMFEQQHYHVIVNVPRFKERPHLIPKDFLAQSYIPRTTRQKRVCTVVASARA